MRERSRRICGSVGRRRWLNASRGKMSRFPLLFLLCYCFGLPICCLLLENQSSVVFAARATIMNFFRVPLNLIVVIILTQVKCSVGADTCCCQRNAVFKQNLKGGCYPGLQCGSGHSQRRLGLRLGAPQVVPWGVYSVSCSQCQCWIFRLLRLQNMNKG